MAQPHRETRPQFSQPFRQIIMMVVAFGLAGFGAFVALPRVLPVFEANPYLNGFILFVFVIGVLMRIITVRNAPPRGLIAHGDQCESDGRRQCKPSKALVDVKKQGTVDNARIEKNCQPEKGQTLERALQTWICNFHALPNV